MTRISLNLALVAIVLTTLPARSVLGDTFEQVASRPSQTGAHCVRFFPDSSKFAILDNGRVRICESESGGQLAEIRTGKIDMGTMWISDDGERLVTATYSGSLVDINLWDVKNGKPISAVQLEKNYLPDAIAPISDQKYVVLSGSTEKKEKYSVYHAEATLVDLRANKVLGIFQTESPPCSIAVSADKKKVVIGEEDGSVSIWDAASMHREHRFGSGGRQHVVRVFLSKDSKTLITEVGYKELTLRNMSDFSRVGTLRVNKEVITAVAMSADGKRLAACASDFAVGVPQADGSITASTKESYLTLWDLDTQKEIASARAHEGAVEFIDFSRDGKMIVTSGDDKLTKIWRIK